MKIRLRPDGGPGRAGGRKDSLESGEWQQPGATELLFSKWSRDLFNAILEEEKLRVDRDGRLRTAYIGALRGISGACARRFMTCAADTGETSSTETVGMASYRTLPGFPAFLRYNLNMAEW